MQCNYLSPDVDVFGNKVMSDGRWNIRKVITITVAFSIYNSVNVSNDVKWIFSRTLRKFRFPQQRFYLVLLWQNDQSPQSFNHNHTYRIFKLFF